jgi:hypothetical protein
MAVPGQQSIVLGALRLIQGREQIMKFRNLLGLLAVAAAALMAFAGTASASTVTSPSGTAYTGTITASAGTMEFVGSFTTVKCTNSTLGAVVKTHGAALTIEGWVENLTFSGCNFEITVKKGGFLFLHASGGGNAVVTWSTAEVIIHTSVGECVFTTNNTQIGTLSGGTPANLPIASAAIPRTGGNFLCGSSAKWSGKYTFNTPGTLFVS